MRNQRTHTKAALLTHPVRLRILMALSGTQRTAQQIAAIVNDVPASSIYRHIQLLLDAGVIEVVAERRVRGAVERTFQITGNSASVEPDEAQAMSVDDQRRAFQIFMVHLLHEWEQYLERPDHDPVRDLTGFRTAVVYATDEEWLAAIAGMNEVFRPLLHNQPRADRRARRFATISFVADEPQEHST